MDKIYKMLQSFFDNFSETPLLQINPILPESTNHIKDFSNKCAIVKNIENWNVF